MSKQDDPLAPLLQNEAALRLVGIFHDHGHALRFIGGAVRDCLLQRPLHDIDFATDSPPERSLEILEKHGIRALETGIKYGTVTAVVDHTPFEITTLRRDVATYGRDADVVFTDDWEQDARRRDFTINALSVDGHGAIHDYCDGQKDLAARRLRFIGDAEARIQEDYLRILRYFRFAAQLGWSLDDHDTLSLCVHHAPRLQDLSRERIQSEISKILVSGHGEPIVHLLQELGIWKILTGKDADLKRFDRLAAIEKAHHAQPHALRRLMALFGYRDTSFLEKIIVPSNHDKKLFQAMQHLDAYRRDNRSVQRQLYDFGADAVKDFHFLNGITDLLETVAAWKKPVFPLKAADIMPFNRGSDRLLGQTLKAAENYWVDNGFNTSKNELLTLAIGFLNNENQ